MKGTGDTPFSTLGIAPTADLAVVKRAYFAALAKHPPHADPQGFQRLRAAYEPLSTPEGLRAAFALVPPDVATELARYRARYDQLLAASAASWNAAALAAEAGPRLKRSLMKMTLAGALAAFGPPPPSSQ